MPKYLSFWGIFFCIVFFGGLGVGLLYSASILKNPVAAVLLVVGLISLLIAIVVLLLVPQMTYENGTYAYTKAPLPTGRHHVCAVLPSLVNGTITSLVIQCINYGRDSAPDEVWFRIYEVPSHRLPADFLAQMKNEGSACLQVEITSDRDGQYKTYSLV